MNLNHRLSDEVIACVEKVLVIQRIYYPKDPSLSDLELKALAPSFVINFLCDRIHRGSILTYPNINFHPGTPEYPGRGGASFAIFDGLVEYGATSHAMIDSVDQGDIFDVLHFPIKKGERCDQVFDHAEDACLVLLKRSLEYMMSGQLPPVRADLRWKRKATSRKEFQKWLVLDPTNEEEFHRKIEATKHRLFPGPYLEVYGHRFALEQTKGPVA